jgi:hypothetical protein
MQGQKNAAVTVMAIKKVFDQFNDPLRISITDLLIQRAKKSANAPPTSQTIHGPTGRNSPTIDPRSLIKLDYMGLSLPIMSL